MKIFNFEPTEDLTVMELAEIYKITMTAIIQGMAGRPWNGNEELQIPDQIYNTLSDNAKRHFNDGQSTS